jgi:hypothetical protein
MSAKICHQSAGDILPMPLEILDHYPLGDMPAPRLHPKDGNPRHPWRAIG